MNELHKDVKVGTGLVDTDPWRSQLQLWHHCRVHQISIHHQSDLNGVRCEGQDVRECTDWKTHTHKQQLAISGLTTCEEQGNKTVKWHGVWHFSVTQGVFSKANNSVSAGSSGCVLSAYFNWKKSRRELMAAQHRVWRFSSGRKFY